ncbi:MAG: DEAD/DEAH box helicase family protein, partial [Nitrososphaera sp.]
LAHQIEAQTRNYEVCEEVMERGLALVKLDGFQKAIDEDGAEIYTAEVYYPVDRERLLARWEDWHDQAGRFGFHYVPYNFESNPEQNFFEQLLTHLHIHPEEVEDIYFTGALTDPKKTDFYVEYKGDDNKWHRYTPDFIIRRKDGKCLIVEIKDARFETATRQDLTRDEQGKVAITVEGRKAVALKKWERLNPDRLKYQILFANNDLIGYDEIREAYEFVKRKNAT